MRGILIIYVLFPFLLFGQEVSDVAPLSSQRFIEEESTKFFFQNLIDNKMNAKFKFVNIGNNKYSLTDRNLPEMYPKYSYFQQPSLEFFSNFSTYLLDSLFKTEDSIVLKNLQLSLKFASSEFYSFLFVNEGLDKENYRLDITSPFNGVFSEKKIRNIYFNKSGLIEKVEEYMESKQYPDTMKLKSITTFLYSKGFLKEKIIERINIHSGFTTEKQTFKFNHLGNLKEMIMETFNDPGMKVKPKTIRTICEYKNGNLTKILTTIDKKRLIYGYEITYNSNSIEAKSMIDIYSSYHFVLSE